MYSHKTAALVGVCLIYLTAPLGAQEHHEQGSLQLQQNGIPLRNLVSSSSSSVPTPGYLSVKVTMFKAQALSRTIGFIYAYNLHVGFKQQVQLATSKAYITAETWTQNTLGIHPAPKLQELNKTVLDLVNQFSDDY